MLNARFKTHLHSELHDEEIKEYLLHHDFGRNAWLNDFLLSKRIERVPNSIVSVKFDDQKQNEDFNTLIVKEDEINITVIHLKGDTVPCIKWEAVLPLVEPALLLIFFLFTQFVFLMVSSEHGFP